jgi:hypothetical protein
MLYTKAIVNHRLRKELMNPLYYPSLAHFFDMTELPVSGSRTDVTCLKSGLIMNTMMLDTDDVSASIHNVATEYGVTEPTTKDSRFTKQCQPDWGSGATLTCSAEYTNLGSDNWLMFAVGHHLNVNASGTNLAYGALAGAGGNVSYINMTAANFVSGDYSGGGIVVRDTNSNDITMTVPTDLASGRRCGVANVTRFGAKEPYMYALYRQGNTLTRRIKALLSGEVRITTADCSGLNGDVHPNAGWFWADFITYGHCLFHFQRAFPGDIDQGCDWMATQWSNDPLRKLAYPGWAGL